MLYRKKKVIWTVLAGIILVVWGGLVYDVNKRLPAAQYIEYSKTSPAIVNGLSIVPVKNTIYTRDAFEKAYPQYNHYDEWNPSENDRLVVYELALENVISDEIWFNTVLMEAFEKESYWSNGINVIEENKASIIIAPGKKEKIQVVAFIGGGSLSQKQLSELKNENLGLSLSYYPQNVVLRFEGTD